jgi:hypothetical protein
MYSCEVWKKFTGILGEYGASFFRVDDPSDYMASNIKKTRNLRV